MALETIDQVKQNFQTLIESLWISSSLKVFLETDALAILTKETSVAHLGKITHLPLEVLKQMINVLSASGFIILKNDCVVLSSGFQEFIKNAGLEKLKAQLRVTFGITNEFVSASAQKNLRAGWHYTDETLLQAQGSFSEYIVTDCMPMDTHFENLLARDNACFLDVGAGVGKISIQVCQLYPKIKVVALEPANIPFSLAQKNIEQAGYTKQIELRKNYIQEITDKNVFDAVWYPHIFFSDEVFTVGLTKVWNALKPGGMIFTNAIFPEQKNQSLYIRQLINSLCGGFRTGNEVITALTKTGFNGINIMSEIAGYKPISASKPSQI